MLGMLCMNAFASTRLALRLKGLASTWSIGMKLLHGDDGQENGNYFLYGLGFKVSRSLPGFPKRRYSDTCPIVENAQ